MSPIRRLLCCLLPAALLTLTPIAAHADGGWFVGGAAGQAYLEIDVEGSEQNVFGFDESGTAWKVYGGYVWDLPLIDLGIEAGYVDLADPVAQFPGFTAQLDPSGLNVWGTLGVDLGPVGLYGKLGALAWNIDGKTSGLINESFDESGTDLGFGLGLKFMIGSLEIRGEYENYDIEDTENVEMLSLGLAWVF